MNLDQSKLTLKMVCVVTAAAMSLAIAGAGAVYTIRADIQSLQKDLLPREEFIDWRDKVQDDNPVLKIPRIPRTSSKGTR